VEKNLGKIPYRKGKEGECPFTVKGGKKQEEGGGKSDFKKPCRNVIEPDRRVRI